MRKLNAAQRLAAVTIAAAFMVPLLTAGQEGALAKQDVGVDTFTVNDSRNDQLHPRIGGKYAVWQDYRDIEAHTGDDVNADIYAYILDARDDFKVSDAHTSSHPDVSGDIVAYADKRNGDKDIRGHNLRTDEAFWVVRRSGSDQDRPAVSGNIVVWQDNRDGNWDLRGKNLDTDEEFWVSHRDGNQLNPRIAGKWVVWEDDRDGCCDVYLKNLDSGEMRRVTESNDAHEPDVSKDWVVYRRGDGDSPSVYAYSIKTADTIRLNTNRSELRGQPSVDGNIAVWSDRRNGDSFNILGYDLDARQEFLVARSDVDEREPAVAGMRIAWTVDRGTRGSDIRGASLTITPDATSTPTATPTSTVSVPAPTVGPPVSQGPCAYVLGFNWLHDQIVRAEGNIVGQCLENEWHNPDNGDGLQRTTGRGSGAIGMFAWRKADNWTAYTDGNMTWLWGPCGLQKRFNSGPYFAWEGRQGAPCS